MRLITVLSLTGGPVIWDSVFFLLIAYGLLSKNVCILLPWHAYAEWFEQHAFWLWKTLTGNEVRGGLTAIVGNETFELNPKTTLRFWNYPSSVESNFFCLLLPFVILQWNLDKSNSEENRIFMKYYYTIKSAVPTYWAGFWAVEVSYNWVLSIGRFRLEKGTSTTSIHLECRVFAMCLLNIQFPSLIHC